MSIQDVCEITAIRAQLRRQRHLLHLSLSGWICGAAILLSGATSITPLHNLRVDRLAIVDDNGVERLILEADNTHGRVGRDLHERRFPISGIILQNANGDEMGGMGTNSNGDAVVALDSYSPIAPGVVDRVALFSAVDGTAGLKLNDIEMNQRAILASGTDKTVELQLQDGGGLPRIHGQVTADGRGLWEIGVTRTTPMDTSSPAPTTAPCCSLLHPSP